MPRPVTLATGAQGALPRGNCYRKRVAGVVFVFDQEYVWYRNGAALWSATRETARPLARCGDDGGTSGISLLCFVIGLLRIVPTSFGWQTPSWLP